MWNLIDAIDDLLQKALDHKSDHPSREMSIVCTKLEEALLWARRDDELRDIQESGATHDE